MAPTKIPGTDTQVQGGPPKDANPLEKAAAPIATLSSHSDPWPHYIMSAACVGGSAFAYTRMANPRIAAIAGALGLTYFYAGRQLVTGNPTLGYDLGSVASIALVGTTGPAAMAAGETLNVALASLGGISTVANLIKSYQMRSNQPQELDVSKRH